MLIPVLDNSRHSYVSQNDIEILMQKGQGWLEQHPERDWITRRFLRNIRTIANEAILRLAGEEAVATEEYKSPLQESLHQQRLNRAFERLRDSGASKVLDLGCGSGKLLQLLLKERQFRKITGMDVSFSELQQAKENLYLDEASPALLGALLEQLGYAQEADRLRESLNPLTKYKLGISESILPNRKDWNII